MKWVVAAAVLMTLPAAAAPKPQRIMSLKICTDALLLDLVAPSRIASVTFLAHEKAALKYWPQAAGVPVNHNTAEEILATRPDLILTDTFTAPSLRPLLARSGARVVEVPPAESFEQIRAVTRMVAAAVGEQARGEVLVARMDGELRAMATHRPANRLTVAGWGGGGYVPGSGGLFDAMLAEVGARNVEAGPFGYYDVETLIAKNPDALVYAETYSGTASLRDDQNMHPALLKRYAGRRVSYDSLYGCGVPETALAAKRLQAALSKVSPPRPEGAQ
jgi:iron complex transport system substrate-binding protein